MKIQLMKKMDLNIIGVLKMKLKNILVVILFLPAVVFVSCGEKEEPTKSVEEIRKEEGVPVKIRILDTKPFEKYYSFFAKLSGIKEATKGAIVGGKIEKINAMVGEQIAKDQVIVEFDETNPGLQYEQAKTGLTNAEKTYLRLKTLLEAGETSQANFDGAETQYLVAKRNYESLKQMLFIESPFEGILVDIKVNEGDNVDKDTHLFTVAQLNKMRAKVWASESEIRQIKKGMVAQMNYNGKKYSGRVVDVSLAADPFKQAFYAEVEFDNPNRELKSGVIADIKILTYKNSSAVIVSRNLVSKDEKGNYVFVVKNGIAEKRYIKNGNDSGLDYEVKEGLAKGDNLVVQGNTLLDNGTKVKVIQ